MYPIMTPATTSTAMLCTTRATRSTIPMAIMAPRNAAAIMVMELNARRLSASTTMVTATISLAPEEIPRMYGPAMGLWK